MFNLMRSKGVAAGLSVVLAGCTTSNYEKEINSFVSSVEAVVPEVEEILKTTVSSEEGTLKRATALVDANGRWVLSDTCLDKSISGTPSKFDECRVILKSTNGEIPEPTSGEAGLRKLVVLKDYIQTLQLVASAKSDEDIKIALAVLDEAVKELNVSRPSRGLTEFSQQLVDEGPKIGEAANYFTKAVRNSEFRKLVSSANGDITQIIREIIAQADLSSSDPKYEEFRKKMISANRNAERADALGTREEKIMAYEALKMSSDAFTEHAKTSLSQKLMNIALTHSSLVARVKQGASTQEIGTFLSNLNDLKLALEA